MPTTRFKLWLLESSAAFAALIHDGLGTQGSNKPGHRVYAHPGGGPGVDAGLRLYLDQDCAIAFMSNFDPPFPQLLASAAGDMIAGE